MVNAHVCHQLSHSVLLLHWYGSVIAPEPWRLSDAAIRSASAGNLHFCTYKVACLAGTGTALLSFQA